MYSLLSFFIKSFGFGDDFYDTVSDALGSAAVVDSGWNVWLYWNFECFMALSWNVEWLMGESLV
jgi:hypothetical protein